MFVQGDRSLEQQCLIYTPNCPTDGDDAMMNDEVSYRSNELSIFFISQSNPLFPILLQPVTLAPGQVSNQ